MPDTASPRFVPVLLLCAFGLCLSATAVTAEDLSREEMVCALDPQCTLPFASYQPRGANAVPSSVRPGSFDRPIQFAFDSAELTPEAQRELDNVAAVLTDPSVDKFPIIIKGHTDAVGTAEYNQELSERRAQAARNYLINRHGIDPTRLAARGFGKSQLLMPSAPTSEVNRRVEFENMNYATQSAGTTSAPRPGPVATSRPTTASRPTASAPVADSDGL
jgi:outer membrane protein OmpA-like peptidoglycan-associated protein